MQNGQIFLHSQIRMAFANLILRFTAKTGGGRRSFTLCSQVCINEIEKIGNSWTFFTAWKKTSFFVDELHLHNVKIKRKNSANTHAACTVPWLNVRIRRRLSIWKRGFYYFPNDTAKQKWRGGWRWWSNTTPLSAADQKKYQTHFLPIKQGHCILFFSFIDSYFIFQTLSNLQNVQ